ncbi:DUF1987 domain-containing protein [Nannocystis bainbridge]|uniref:DUF1987 domain-containing protein n=1 Tax=Nannocystis bainbridge TaxID=2995303 RepID=A0ABT5DWY5_9BACT|nr:DUF1987 domain-containing protein [Nannocystis bainbridge]MDC0718137.1 DUF1987 domain-containing protein [Nannocystis bainbridge]
MPAQVGSNPTPRVDFDGELGLLRLEGESHPEEAALFYAPLILWLDALIVMPPASVVLELRLTYFNAATRPQLVALLRRLKKWTLRGAAVRATWYVDPGDEDMVDVAGDLAAMSGLAIRVANTAIEETPMLDIAV